MNFNNQKMGEIEFNKLKILNIQLSPKDKIKGLKLPIELSRDLAYFCGVLAGDGSIYTRLSKHDYILKCVGNPQDEKEFYFEVIEPIFEKLFEFKINPQFQDGDTTFGFVVYSKALHTFFTQIIGLPNGKKYGELRIPRIFKYDRNLIFSFIQGLADTDFYLGLKRGSKNKPFYPVIVGASKSKSFMEEVSNELEKLNFKVTKYFDYKRPDKRFKNGYSIINRIELCGHHNYGLWMKFIGFRSPKHLKKTQKMLNF